ncbi:olfactory receptor family 2 subfamily W member 1 [Mus musculus]|uniref:Olfactory receptor n=2 Tax=Mus musculus TaxID=10090 RepID=Q7TQT8_MOUSE|nr:olfactory receptor family 2 subfamily W member 1 [Mus musculus]AAI16919.1 Olfactory receptor 42 [Mus musculus]AAI20699.1 Olfactory receptor 42 [Mus musculus]AAP71753.1 olfactory receptor Olfr42 [Mus musculus]EDL32674.1 mCG1044816 [Mus musculus]|eukprot:NP_035114.1 olfactory receptor 263 [Mus musculus]
MDPSNYSTLHVFILLGFSDHPHLEMILSGVVTFFYIITLVGNTAIILASLLDPHLHTPMYFFLRNLSFLDLCFTTSIVPQMLVNLWGPEKTISSVGCIVQLYVYMWLGSIECLLLAVMSYDRFTAICKPLHYFVIMNPRLCVKMIVMVWGISLANSVILCTLTVNLPRCGHNILDHFLCELPAMVRIACVDTTTVELSVFALGIVIVLTPLILILISYGYIAKTVLNMKSKAGQQKAMNTCGSHLTVVSIFYGTIIYMYLQPGNRASKDQGKFLTLFYTIITPSLNPLIYTLRNRDMKDALKKLMRFYHRFAEVRRN